jgi:hypothetical protein
MFGKQPSAASMSGVTDQLPDGEPATPAPMPELIDTSRADSVGEPSKDDPSSALPVPRWLFNLVGHVLAALLGLVLGYLILARLRPLTFPLPW